MPQEYESYLEPMVGSAALFFAARPKRAILADLNAELTNYYKVLRDSAETLINALMQMSASIDTYYRLRSIKPTGRLQQAVRFAYLNRLCWNGVYRVNRAGDFNVPIGSRLPKELWNPAHLQACSQTLQAAEIHTLDVLTSIELAKKGDFLFVDPPYPKGAAGLGFNRYTPTTFSLADHRLLSEALQTASSRGVKIMIILSKERKFISLYAAGFNRSSLPSKSLIACTGESRGSWTECVLINYEPGGNHD